MSRGLDSFLVLIANLAWLCSCLAGLVRFWIASHHPRTTQKRLLFRLLECNAASEFGQKHGFITIDSAEAFRQVPLSEYEDYGELINRSISGENGILTTGKIVRLQPTSGTTAATKLIPYTHALQDEFRAAIDPWIASLYLSSPSLLGGRQYWAISPNTQYKVKGAVVPVGFGDDSEYLGILQRFFARQLMAVPAELSRVADPAAFEYLTLLFLLRAKDLRLVSVWHPSFFTLLIDAVPRLAEKLIQDIRSGGCHGCPESTPEIAASFENSLSPCPVRAAELERIDYTQADFPSQLWPELTVISCWDAVSSRPWIDTLKQSFPNAAIQGKGLVATEGIVSLPIGRGGLRPCAVTSHYFEFIDALTGSVSSVWDVKEGREYSVVITTGGGLYRYRPHDLVRVSGFYKKTPCIEFIGRDRLTSDIVGEKLSGVHVDQVLQRLEKTLKVTFDFVMLAPVVQEETCSYVFFAEWAPEEDINSSYITDFLDTLLSENYHYAHARKHSQLLAPRLFRIRGNAALMYRACLVNRGMKQGDVKFISLSTDQGWMEAFEGEFIS